MNQDRAANAILAGLMSPNVKDGNGESANVVDVIHDVGRALHSIKEAIMPGVEPAENACGDFVGSLTESVMGITSGLVRIADAIHDLADAIRETKSPAD